MSGIRETYKKLKLWEKILFHGLIIVGVLLMVVGVLRIIAGLKAIL